MGRQYYNIDTTSPQLETLQGITAQNQLDKESVKSKANAEAGVPEA